MKYLNRLCKFEEKYEIYTLFFCIESFTYIYTRLKYSCLYFIHIYVLYLYMYCKSSRGLPRFSTGKQHRFFQGLNPRAEKLKIYTFTVSIFLLYMYCASIGKICRQRKVSAFGLYILPIQVILLGPIYSSFIFSYVK